MQIIVFILGLSLLITIHELGHFIIAKIFGVYCHEFSIGMGPAIFSIKKGETKYSVRWLPIGGYVSMAGEEVNQDENVHEPTSEENIDVRTYINDMDRCLSAADLVICRAGASSLSEIQALGKPSILIPSPNSVAFSRCSSIFLRISFILP